MMTQLSIFITKITVRRINMGNSKLIMEYHTGYFCKDPFQEKLTITSSYISYKKNWRTFDYAFDLDYIDEKKANIYWKKDFPSKMYFRKHGIIIWDILKALEKIRKDIIVLDGDGLSVKAYAEGHKICDEYFCPSAECDTIQKIAAFILPYIEDMPCPEFLFCDEEES